jgi:hypothetical protein
MIFSISKLIIS